MTIAEMFGQSGVLALLGMAVVFSFLFILIIFMNLVARLIRSFGWDSDVRSPNDAPAVVGASEDSAAVVAAVTAAVNTYRKNNA